MDDGANETAEEMTGSLMGDLESLVECGEMSAEEAEMFREFLGSPYGA